MSAGCLMKLASIVNLLRVSQARLLLGRYSLFPSRSSQSPNRFPRSRPIFQALLRPWVPQSIHTPCPREDPPVASSVRACASSSFRINPACIAKPTAAVAKKPKRPGSLHDGDPPAKRARAEVEPDAATKIKRCPRPSSDEDRCPAGSLRKGVEALCVTKNQASASPVSLPEVTVAPPKRPACSMRELLERARLAKACPAAADAGAEAVRRREIERRRAEARREMDQVVQTVEFNDPFIDPQDVLK